MTRRIALLLFCLLLPVASFAATPSTLTEGVDYERVEQPGTYLPTKKGEVEIVEIFAYTCPHCAHLAPELEAWKAKLPKNVRVRYTPAGYDPTDTLSRGFFASEALGTLGLTHASTFRAIHEAYELPRNPTDAELAAYYKTLGVDAAKFQAEMDGAKVMQRMQAAKAFSLRVGLQGTPSLIVAGRWRVLGHSLEDMLRIAGELAVHPPQGSPL